MLLLLLLLLYIILIIMLIFLLLLSGSLYNSVYIYIHNNIRNNIHISTYIYINQHDSIVMPELDQRKVALNIWLSHLIPLQWLSTRLKLKQNWISGCYALGSSYIALPWLAGQCTFGQAPWPSTSHEICVVLEVVKRKHRVKKTMQNQDYTIQT